ncbi:MAG: NlpC/P60 family protein [Chlorobiaceae bacterium]
MIERIITEAKSWLRTPYHHEGNIKGAGVDCAMILIEVYSAVGALDWFDPRPYPRQWMLHRSEERYLDGVIHYTDEVDVPEPGDMVLVRFGRTMSHSAIIIEGSRVIHACATCGFVTWGDLTQPPFIGREMQFFRMRNLKRA